MLTIESLIAGCGNIVTLHEALGKILGAFKHCSCLRRTDNRYILCTGICFQLVVDTFYQGILRTNHYHVDLFVSDKSLDCLEVISLHGDILTAVTCTSITWGNIKFLTLTTLSNFPSQGVLTSATS